MQRCGVWRRAKATWPRWRTTWALAAQGTSACVEAGGLVRMGWIRERLRVRPWPAQSRLRQPTGGCFLMIRWLNWFPLLKGLKPYANPPSVRVAVCRRNCLGCLPDWCNLDCAFISTWRQCRRCFWRFTFSCASLLAFVARCTGRRCCERCALSTQRCNVGQARPKCESRPGRWRIDCRCTSAAPIP